MVDLKRASKNTYETVVKIALRYKPKKILDLGSGKGGLIKQLYDAGLNVTASDMDTEQFKVPNVTCLKIDLNKKDSLERLKSEVERHNQFSRMVFGSQAMEIPKKMDLKIYAKYVLEKGTREEKRELLIGLKSKLILKDKKVGVL